MATISRFEDLNCWKLARELENLIWELTKHGTFEKDFGLKDQINRAAGSTMETLPKASVEQVIENLYSF
jgi:four helix bundle protein